MNVAIERVHTGHLAEISALAGVIWRASYPGIISPEQIDYMLARMYDVETLRGELASGIVWFRALINGELRGFASVGPTETATEFKLHKLYVHPDWQRHGLGSALLKNCETTARTHGAAALILNVNKRNTAALAVYRQRGFVIRESIVADIGGGFVMDDYVMVKALGGSDAAS
jgi:ribosomal protein S18 acetylase RimI-like enzyme